LMEASFQKRYFMHKVDISGQINKKQSESFASLNTKFYLCKVMKKFIFAILWPFILSCSSNKVADNLAKVDTLVAAEEYDSAYAVLAAMEDGTVMDPEDEAHYYLLSTQVSYLDDKPLESDSLLDKAITYYSETRNRGKLADCYYYKSNRSMNEGNYSKAILYAKKAEQNAKELKQRFKIAERLTYLNELCNNYTLQLEYAQKSLELASLAQNGNWLAYSYNNVATAFSNLDNSDSARYYVVKAIPYVNNVEEKNKAGFLANIGMLYKNMLPDKAKEFFQKSLAHEETSGALENLADIYFAEGRQEEAYNLWKKALTINDGDYKDNIIYSILSYDLERGDIDKVCNNIDAIIHIKDSMLHQLKNDTIKDLQLRFDHEAAMRQQERKTGNWQKGGLVGVIIVLLLAAYIIFRRYREKIKIQEVQIQINDYRSQIVQLENSGKEYGALINKLEKQIKNRIEEFSPKLKHGYMLYEQVKDGSIKTISRWTKEDERLFVEFYKMYDYRTVKRLTDVKRAEPLTTHRLFYLLLKEMGKNDMQIKELLGVSDNNIKVLRCRTKEIK